jgi:hypothetical protein
LFLLSLLLVSDLVHETIYLRRKDIQPIKRNGEIIAAKIIVYTEDEEEYFSFITTEAYDELEKWMNYRKEYILILMTLIIMQSALILRIA